MKIWPDCIPCILRMSLLTARVVMSEEKRIISFFTEVLDIPALAGKRWDATAPEVLTEVWTMLQSHTGIADPLSEMKRRATEAAMAASAGVKSTLSKHPDPFEETVKIAIMGNSIDVMLGTTGVAVQQALDKIRGLSLPCDSMQAFEGRLKQAKQIVYICDNCGEIVLDRLLIELIKDRYGPEITVLTRTLPVLNDATLEDALLAGLDRSAKVLENGISHPFPGTSLGKLSDQARRCIDEADLIISKGGGNFDTLTEEASLKGKVTYLLQVKCHPYEAIHQQPLGALAICNG
jgi:uncharacterized protein with ATP-grasp and redox domains